MTTGWPGPTADGSAGIAVQPRAGRAHVATGSVAVGVTVQQHGQPRAGSHIEQAERPDLPCDLAEGGQQQGTPADLVGLGMPRRQDGGEFGLVGAHEGPEGRPRVTGVRVCREVGVEAGQVGTPAGQQQVVNGGEQQHRQPLGGRGWAQHGGDLGVLRGIPGDVRVERSPRLVVGGEVGEASGERPIVDRIFGAGGGAHRRRGRSRRSSISARRRATRSRTRSSDGGSSAWKRKVPAECEKPTIRSSSEGNTEPL